MIIVKIDEIMASALYRDISAYNLVASARRFGLGHRWSFEQADASNTESTQKLFKKKKKKNQCFAMTTSFS